jgi:hypothetical protein
MKRDRERERERRRTCEKIDPLCQRPHGGTVHTLLPLGLLGDVPQLLLVAGVTLNLWLDRCCSAVITVRSVRVKERSP